MGKILIKKFTKITGGIRYPAFELLEGGVRNYLKTFYDKGC